MVPRGGALLSAAGRSAAQTLSARLACFVLRLETARSSTAARTRLPRHPLTPGRHPDRGEASRPCAPLRHSFPAGPAGHRAAGTGWWGWYTEWAGPGSTEGPPRLGEGTACSATAEPVEADLHFPHSQSLNLTISSIPCHSQRQIRLEKMQTIRKHPNYLIASPYLGCKTTFEQTRANCVTALSLILFMVSGTFFIR